MTPKLIQISKFLTLILRHKPEVIGIKLNVNGWAKIADILPKLDITFPELLSIVINDTKGRFAINEEKGLIRANQGHSIKVTIDDIVEQKPPDSLYHGTTEEAYAKILKHGSIIKMKRQFVHLTDNLQTAESNAKRFGKAFVVLVIDSNKMYFNGYKFYISANGVWLTDFVPSNYISCIPYKTIPEKEN